MATGTAGVCEIDKGGYTLTYSKILLFDFHSERITRALPNVMAYKLLEACREPGCPVCRLEQRSVERYLDSQFYESVNNPAWRDRLRASLGFCQEHAWLAVDQRLGDALGFAIIYRD